jgi:signal transduction histidine kinase
VPHEPIETVLGRLGSGDWRAIRDNIDAVGEALRAKTLPAASMPDVGARFAALANHPKWEVRKALAHALEYVRDDSFLPTISHLLTDSNSWVRGAAERVVRSRTDVASPETLREEHQDSLAPLLADIEARFGRAGRRMALRLAEAYNGLVLREAYHELVSGLTALENAGVKLGANLAKPRLDRPTALKQHGRIMERLRFVQAVTDSLRQLATDAGPVAPTPERLLNLLREAAYNASARFPERRFEIRFDVAPSLMAELCRYRLMQALGNIMQNAFEAYGAEVAEPFLDIRAQEIGGGRVRISIADGGCGIPEDALPDVFRLFSTSKKGGSGIGLTLAKRVIEHEHGGTLRVESKKGQGTTVLIELPVERE